MSIISPKSSLSPRRQCRGVYDETDFEIVCLYVCHFTEMTSLNQNVLMNMQKVERTSNIVLV